MSQLEDLLRQCTVKLTTADRMGWGTGFFVAPELILTCAHVVQRAKDQLIQVEWQNQETWAHAVMKRSLPVPYDLALLQVTLPTDVNPPCVYLDKEVRSRDPLYLYGYPDQDYPNGCPATFSCEGLTGDEPNLIKFALGQVRPGMSGSPLLNQRTGKVCGIVKFTRNRSSDLGGGAITSSTILTQFPELILKNHQFHQSNLQWTSLLPKLFFSEQVDRDTYTNQQIILNRVRNCWIKRYLESSLYSQFPIELQLEERFDVLSHRYETPDLPAKRLGKGTRVIDIFDNLGVGRTLLILGSPGSGKTTILLELAKVLTNRAEQNVNLPLPVVFNLSSWSSPKTGLKNWLIQDLNKQYSVSELFGESWIEKQKFLLLLDGLDEIKAELREACLQAINKFCIEYGQTEIVVCSRFKPYKAASHKLNFQGAILISPLESDQVSNYLEQIGSQSSEVELAIQQDPTLQELAQTPLMLSIMTFAYKDIPTAKLNRMSLEGGRCYLFNKYIGHMFRRQKGECAYSEEQVRYWLSFLAQKMEQESQTLFLIENIQSSWLQSGFQQWIYLSAVGIFSGVIVELSFGIFVGFTAGSLSAEIFFGLISSMILGLTSELFKLNKLPQFGKAIWRETFIILSIGLIAGILSTLLGKSIIGITGRLIQGTIYGLVFGSIVIIIRIVAALAVTRTKPNVKETMRLNQKNYDAFTNSLIVSSIAFFLIVLPTIFFFKAPTRISLVVLLSIIYLLSGGLFFVQHITLRFLLWWAGKAPWNYARFLSWADKQLLLQRVGVSYQFPHNLLREHWQKNIYQPLQYSSQKQWFSKILIALSLIGVLMISLIIPIAFDTVRVRDTLAKHMSPLVQQGERIIIDKYKFSQPKLGDVVLYYPPSCPNDQSQTKLRSLKIIAGLPGNHVTISNGEINVSDKNGKSLNPKNIPLVNYSLSKKTMDSNSYLLISTQQVESQNKLSCDCDVLARTFDIANQNEIIGKRIRLFDSILRILKREA